MQVSAGILSQLLNGKLEGNPDVLVSKPSKIEEGDTGSICFLANPKYEQYLYTTEASVVLIDETFTPATPVKPTLIRVKNVYEAVQILLDKFGAASAPEPEAVISERCVIEKGATLGSLVSIGHFSVVGEGAAIGDNTVIFNNVSIGKGVQIGADCIIYPGVVIQHGCIIGDRCIIHPNAVIGSDGFGFARTESGSYKKIAQIGIVHIEDDVEIGANTTIDRATMGATRIKKGAKLDNLIQIAHNVVVGEHTGIAAQAGIAGSSQIGNSALIGGQAGIAGHLKVADGAMIQAQSGIASNIDIPGSKWYGSPAIAYNNYLRSYAVFKQLPDLLKRVESLENGEKDL